MEIKIKISVFAAVFGLMCGANRTMTGAHNVLHEAAKRGDVAATQRLVSAGVRVSAADDTGKTALHWAAQNGQAEVVRQLIDAGADINVVDGDGNTLLHCAAANGHKDIVKLLIEENECALFLGFGIHIDAENKYGRTALHHAAHFGHLSVAQLLLNAGANVNAVDNNGLTALLHHAARFGDLNVVQLLLNAGAGFDAVNEEGCTPLHCAAEMGHVSVVQLLLEVGADADAVNEEGWTALHRAASNNHGAVAQLLIDFDAEVDPKNIKDTASKASSDDDKGGRTPLSEAARKGHWNIVQLLIAAGADVNAAKDGATPLYYAVLLGKASGYANVQLLLDAGADVNVADESGSTPLHLAASRGSKKVVQLLINAGADVNVADEEKWTPLHDLIMEVCGGRATTEEEINAYIATVRQLIEAGADVDAENDQGYKTLEASTDGFKFPNSQIYIAAHLEIFRQLASASAYLEEGLSFIFEEQNLFRDLQEHARILAERGADIRFPHLRVQEGVHYARLREELEKISDTRLKAVQQWATQLEHKLPVDVVRSVLLPLALPDWAAQIVRQQIIKRQQVESRARSGVQPNSRPPKKQRIS